MHTHKSLRALPKSSDSKFYMERFCKIQKSEPHPKDFDSDETLDMSLESSKVLAGNAAALGPWSAAAEF